MALGVRVHPGQQPVLVFVQVYRIEIAALKGGVEFERGVFDSHSLLAAAVEFELRVIFSKETFQELRLA